MTRNQFNVTRHRAVGREHRPRVAALHDGNPPTNNRPVGGQVLRFGGARRFEVRLDAFNALNHTQFSGVNRTINFASLTDHTITNLPYDANGNLVRNTGVGTVSGVRPARQLQLVTRFSF
jgi:hypothetical protein